MDKIFKLRENNASIKAEIIAGITTFISMAYILLVNPGMFSELSEQTFGAQYISTAISSVIGCILIGLIANLPLAQAPGMGINAFFVYTICLGFGFTYANALLFILADGILFVLFTVTGLRKAIFKAIPQSVKIAIPAGIGLFIAFIGLQDAKLIINDPSTCVGLASFNLLGNATIGSIVPLIITIITVVLIAILSYKGLKGALLWSILIGSVLYYCTGLIIPGFFDGFSLGNLNPFSAFKEFRDYSFLKVLTEGFDFSAYLSSHSKTNLIVSFLTSSLAFCMIDMFDTMGSLFGACKAGNLLIRNENGEDEVPNLEKAMLSDAIATCSGAICGTSTVTTFVEASAGCAAGGKTGLAAIVTALMFAISMFFYPIAQLIPASAYAAALIFVGILMIGCVTEIDWKNPRKALPAFMTVIMMPFTYNITYGIAFGLITYIACNVFSKEEKIHIETWIISILFLVMFMFTH